MGTSTSGSLSKEEVLRRLLVAWERRPFLRLGQLIDNAFACNPTLATMLFYATDEDLIVNIEDFAGVFRD